MVSGNLEVWQIIENRLVEKLPDGSTAVFDTLTNSVHSINETAVAAFEACRERRTVPQVATAMQEILHSAVTEEMALEAISELERAGLVACSAPVSAERAQTSRRSVLKAAGSVAAAAAPLVLSLSMAEQSAYAMGASSGPVASLSGIAPNAMPYCISYAVGGFVITGVNTHFSSSSVVTFSDPNLTASNVAVTSPTSLTLSITNTVFGITTMVTVTVTTGAEVAVGTNILTLGFVEFYCG